jgi:hypothetical protein
MSRVTDIWSGDLFQEPVPAPADDGSQDWRSEVSEIVSTMLKDATKKGRDRCQVAATMATLSGHAISENMLDGYSSPARDTFNLPFSWAPLLEAACGSVALTTWLVTKRGGRLLMGPEAINAEIGRWERVVDEASHKVKELKARARSLK